jgi:predicted PurR-regulated permease PerM
MVEFAEQHGIDLPFTDYPSLKSSALAEVRDGVAIIGRYAKFASFQSLLLLAGLIVALAVFLNPSWTAREDGTIGGENLYMEVTRELNFRFKALYQSFSKVIGAQIIIAAINTVLTAVFLFANGYSYSALLMCLVFLCGLLPIVGNLISNAVVVGVGFTLSPGNRNPGVNILSG